MVFYIVKIYQTVFVSKKIKAKNLDQSFKPEIPDVLTCKPEIPDVLTLEKFDKKKEKSNCKASIYILACLSVCLFVSHKRQNGWTDWAKIVCGIGSVFFFFENEPIWKEKTIKCFRIIKNGRLSKRQLKAEAIYIKVAPYKTIKHTFM